MSRLVLTTIKHGNISDDGCDAQSRSPRHRRHGAARPLAARRPAHRSTQRAGQADAAVPRAAAPNPQPPQCGGGRGDVGAIVRCGDRGGGRQHVVELSDRLRADDPRTCVPQHPRPRGGPSPAVQQPSCQRLDRTFVAGLSDLSGDARLPPRALRPPSRRDGPRRARHGALRRLPDRPRFVASQAHPRRHGRQRLQELPRSWSAPC